MSQISGFSPIANENAKLLILGSMPSEASLKQQQYYGHQRNAFWTVLTVILTGNSELNIADYAQRQQLLLTHNIAVWDVLQSCFRAGSLDSAIKMDSLKTNDFVEFFKAHPKINKVCFNGTKAETIYLKYVLPSVKHQFNYLAYSRLPSTSPANAAVSLQQKIKTWGDEINV